MFAILISFLSLGIALFAFSAEARIITVEGANATFHVLDNSAQPEQSGYGYVEFDQTHPCLSDADRKRIQTELQASRERLRKEGKLRPADPRGTVSFAWPLAPNPNSSFHDEGYHSTYNFVDQDPDFPNQILDYNCGSRTYDIVGYNHQGTDYVLWPFWWYKMDHDQIQVVAAAPGTILFKDAAHPDRSCVGNPSDWNAVYIEHADGTQAWYLHMKQNSLTSKNVGDAVAVGEFLGIVGSSGPSTMPHLHFEVYDSLGNLIDPYAGPCNALNPTSWWQDQPDYFDPAVNALMTHSAPPVFPPCPQQEILNEQIEFPAVSPVVYFAGYYRDQLAGLESQYRIYRPNNSLFQFWSHSSPNYLRASYSYWVFNLGAAPPTGIWRFEVTFNGVTTSHRFGVGTSVTDAGLFSGLDEIRLANSPNPMLGATTIHFNLPQPGPVELSIYGVNGAKVRGLMNSQSPTRTGSVAWDGRDDAGRNVGSGTYFYRLQSGSIDETRKMIMVR